MSLPKIETIPLDAIIDVKISGGFCARLHQMLLAHLQTKSPEEVTKVMQELKTREPQNPFEYHLITILTMINDIEASARDQGKIKMADIPTSTSTS